MVRRTQISATRLGIWPCVCSKPKGTARGQCCSFLNCSKFYLNRAHVEQKYPSVPLDSPKAMHLVREIEDFASQSTN
jgi:hypothetical protein